MSRIALCLTVERRADRAEFFWRHNGWIADSMPFMFVYGADPVAHHFVKAGGPKEPGFTDGQCGAWLGHLSLLQCFIATGRRFAYVFEDDVIIDAALFDHFGKIEEKAGASGVVGVHLGTYNEVGTWGFCVSRESAIKLVHEKLVERKAHIDHQIWDGRDSAVIYDIPLVRHAWDQVESETCVQVEIDNRARMGLPKSGVA